MEIKPKIVLKQKNSTSNLDLDKFQATVRWKTSVDVDLHVLYQTKSGKTGEVSYMKKNHLLSGVSISLDGDAGVGNTVAAQGYNEENVSFDNTQGLARVKIFTNIYSGAANYAKIGAHVLVGKDNHNVAPEVSIEMTSTTRHQYYEIAEIDFTGISPVITSIDTPTSRKPSLSSTAQATTSRGGFLSRLFGN
jgi:uncharacterized protein involved in tellurium resistance